MQKFSDLKGQEMPVKHLRSAVVNGRAAHAYIFDGEKGMGKKTLSSIFAMALQCEKSLDERDNGEPCGVCHSCIMAMHESHPDIITVRHEKISSISVDEIRGQLINDVQIKPYSSPRKIYIIPDADLMTVEAQNSLLKTMEEPPSYITVMLLTENKNHLLPTLLSRAVVIPMRAVDDKDIEALLKKNTEVPENAMTAAISFARGNPGKAEMLCNSEDFLSLWEEVKGVLKGIREMTDAMISSAAEAAASRKADRNDYLSLITIWFRDVLYLKSGGDSKKLIFPEEEYEIEKAAKSYTYEQLNVITEAVKTAASRLGSNVNPENTFEMLFMAMR